MRFIPEVRNRRPGFSLVELLVVIAIIAVLMALTAAAVFQFVGKGAEAQCNSEMSQMAAAIGAFKTEFNVSYMPSRLRLQENGSLYNMNDPLQKRTVAFLSQTFGSRFNAAGNYDWNNDGAISPQPLDLQGHACLVFLLGGIPTRSGDPGCWGFGTNPLNPVDVNPMTGVPNSNVRRGPFFEFKSVRLVRGNGTQGVPANMYAYFDPFRKKQVYAYFSSGRLGNDYCPYGASDCQSLMTATTPPLPLIPYTEQGVQMTGNPPQFAVGTRFMEPRGFQILSAGPDGEFGPVAGWTPSAGYNNLGPGADDRANFQAGRLGNGIR